MENGLLSLVCERILSCLNIITKSIPTATARPFPWYGRLSRNERTALTPFVHTKTEPRDRKASRTRAGRIAAKLRPDSVTAKAALTSFSYTAPALLLTAPGEDPFLFYCLASEEGISQVRMLFCCSNNKNLRKEYARPIGFRGTHSFELLSLLHPIFSFAAGIRPPLMDGNLPFTQGWNASDASYYGLGSSLPLSLWMWLGNRRVMRKIQMGMNSKNRYMFHWDWKEKNAVR